MGINKDYGFIHYIRHDGLGWMVIVDIKNKFDTKRLGFFKELRHAKSEAKKYIKGHV